MPDFAALFKALNDQVDTRDAGKAKETCPKKRKPAAYVLVARTDTAAGVSGVKVDLSKPTSQNKTTDGNGIAKFDPAKRGAHNVTLKLSPEQGKQFAPIGPKRLEVVGETTATAIFLLSPLPSLQVLVECMRTGNPLSGIKVQLVGPTPQKNTLDGTSAPNSGIATFERLLVGSYELRVTLSEAQKKTHRIPVGQRATVAQSGYNLATLRIPPITQSDPVIRVGGKKIALVKPAGGDAASADAKPPRVPVQLSSSTRFDGTAKLSCGEPSKVLLFDTKDGTIPKPFPFTLTTAQVNQGVDTPAQPFTVYLEGKAASSAVDDIELKLELVGGTLPPGPPATDTLTALSLLLELGHPRLDETSDPIVVGEDQRLSIGAILQKQDEKFTRPRARIRILVTPKDAACDIQLKHEGDKLTLFTAKNELHAKGQKAEKFPYAVPAEKIIDEADGLTFWLDGKVRGNTTLELAVTDVAPSWQKATCAVIELRNEGDTAPAPSLIPVKSPLTEELTNHKIKVKLLHSLPAGAFRWRTTTTKFTLTNETTETVTLTATDQPSTTDRAEIMELVYTPTGKDTRTVLQHKVGVVKITFAALAGEEKYYDTYEKIPYRDQAQTDSEDTPDPKYDLIAVKKNSTRKVQLTIEGAKPEDIFLTSDAEATAKPKVEQPTATPYTLEIAGKGKDKEQTVLHARLEAKDGPTANKLGVFVLKKATYKAELFVVVDPDEAATDVNFPGLTGASATKHNKDCFEGGISELKISGKKVKKVRYDTSPKSSPNGALDLSPGTTSEEEKMIAGACASSKARIIYIHELRWSYYFAADTNIATAPRALRLNAPSWAIDYVGVGNTYTLADNAGNSEDVTIASTNTATGEITVTADLTNDYTTADKAALLWPLGGLSGNPAWVQDSPTEAEINDVIGHELGHQLGKFADVCEVANLMYGVNDRTKLRLRGRELKKLYNPGNESQWLTLPR